MINIKEYLFEEHYQNDFICLMKKLYNKYERSELYINNIKKIINPNNPSFRYIEIKNFIAYDGEKVVGHISAMIDKRLNQNGSPVGLIGFYECTQDPELSSNLIGRAIEYLKEGKCNIIRAPIDLTIWHPYRFVVNQKDSFVLEPLTRDYYINQFKSQGFNVAMQYVSAERTDFNTIIPYTKKDYDLAIKEGFKIRTLTSDNFREGILSIYYMINKIFKESWSFVNISKEEYLFIYNDYENNLDTLLIHIISDGQGQEVGFCSSIIDPIKNEIILKTIGIMPEYQSKKVGATLLYYQHRIAQERGIIKEIYALIKKGNIVTRLPYPGTVITREYVTLQKEIIE